jgi:hypothetical protein
MAGVVTLVDLEERFIERAAGLLADRGWEALAVGAGVGAPLLGAYQRRAQGDVVAKLQFWAVAADPGSVRGRRRSAPWLDVQAQIGVGRPAVDRLLRFLDADTSADMFWPAESATPTSHDRGMREIEDVERVVSALVASAAERAMWSALRLAGPVSFVEFVEREWPGRTDRYAAYVVPGALAANGSARGRSSRDPRVSRTIERPRARHGRVSAVHRAIARLDAQ